ncbi:hypothetical protein [Streptomyces sp. NPDC056296]|uniref:hypothetical protein n=1 Tax=Streptomyces sp. NPDC056296 TaxID=3345775 RepID=UPI0035E2BE06
MINGRCSWLSRTTFQRGAAKLFLPRAGGDQVGFGPAFAPPRNPPAKFRFLRDEEVRHGMVPTVQLDTRRSKQGKGASVRRLWVCQCLAVAAAALVLTVPPEAGHASDGPFLSSAAVQNRGAGAIVQSPVPQMVVDQYQLDTRWYAKYVQGPKDQASGMSIAVLGSALIDDATLLKAARQLETLTRTYPYFPVNELRRRNVRIVLTARSERMSSIPEVRARYGTSLDDRYWAGMGATDALPLSVGTEANLLDNQGRENNFVHEFGHSVADMALRHIDSTFAGDLQRAYDQARATGRWSHTYAITNVSEYWAEGIQSYFGVNYEGRPGGDGVHNDINTRSELQRYDAPLFSLLDRVYRGAVLPS